MLLILGSLSALGPASMDGYLPGLPSLTDDLGISTSLAQVTIAAFLVGLGFGQLLAGPLSDIWGRRRPMLTAIVLYVAVTICCAAAPTAEVLLVARFLQGASAAAGIAISRAIVRDLYGGSEGARFLSRLVLIYGIAPLLAPLLGGLIFTFAGWRGIFLGMAAFGAMLFVVAALVLPETLPRERRGQGAARIAASASVLFRDRVFWGYALVLGLSTSCIVAYVSASPFVLQDFYGVSPPLFGVIFGANAAAMIVGSQVNAHLLRRRDTRRLLEVASFALVAVASLLLVAVELGLGLWAVAPCLLGLMGCWGFIPANAISLAMADHGEVAGSASALLGVFQFGLAGLVAPIVGAAGNETALPMAVVVLALSLMSLAAAALMTGAQSRRPHGRSAGRLMEAYRRFAGRV